jgi:hypothetical protein
MRFIAATWFTMVCVARSSVCASSGPSRGASLALRGELDRGQRILDLVREPARDLAPGGGALRGDEPRDVVEHDNVAAARGFRQRRPAQQQHLVPRRQLDLALPVSGLLGEALADRRGEQVELRRVAERRAGRGGDVVAQDRRRAGVGDVEPERRIEGEHAGGKVGEDVLEIGLGALGLDPARLGRRARFVELAGHAVEGARQHPQLVAAGDAGSRGEVAARDRRGGLGELRQRFGQPAAQHERERDGGEQREQQGQRQGHQVDALQTGAQQGQLAVVAVDRLHGLGAVGQAFRHGLHELQEARVLREHLAPQRHDHAHAQAAFARRLGRREVAARARLPERRRRRGRGNERAEVAGRDAQHLSGGRQQHDLLDASLLAQAVERLDLLPRRHIRELERHGAPLVAQVVDQAVQRAAAQAQAAFQRRLDAHVEPRFDGLGEELHRHGVDQRPRDHRHHRQEREHAQRQARPEHARLELAPQRHELVAHQRDEGDRAHHVEGEQQGVVLREQRGVGAGHRQQEQQDAAQRRADDECVGHRGASVAGLAGSGELAISQRYQPLASVHSRLASALTWNGLGSCAVSRRMRTASR